MERNELEKILQSIAIKEGLSEGKLAEKIDLHYITYKALFDDKKNIKFTTIAKVVAFIKSYGFTIDNLMINGNRIDIL